MRFYSFLLQRRSLTGLATVLILFGGSCSEKNEPATKTTTSPTHLLPKLLGSLPHDPTSFTQGLLYNNGRLYESTGLHGKSSIRIVDTSGAVLLKRLLSAEFFGEGCAFFGNRLYQITWTKQHCFVYSPKDLTPVDTLHYSGEGWGLTDNDSLFIMSNGSDTLYFRDHSFAITRKLQITNGGVPLERLNELEYARGYIYANVWFSDFIFEINPATGTVTRIIDCSELVAREAPVSNEQVLNGIAYNPTADLFYLTGKNWKNMFIVSIPG